MKPHRLTEPTDITQLLGAGILLAAAVFVVALAWGYELITGNPPCELCLAQRVPYYIGIVVAGLAAAAVWRGGPAIVGRGLLVLFGLLMLAGMAIAGYHAGVEWGFWAGPSACTGDGIGGAFDAATMLERLRAGGAGIVRCDRPYFRVLGLSFAGWNVLASLFLAILAFAGATADHWRTGLKGR